MKSIKKLVLKKETIASLKKDQMKNLKGGTILTSDPFYTCTYGCTYPSDCGNCGSGACGSGGETCVPYRDCGSYGCFNPETLIGGCISW